MVLSALLTSVAAPAMAGIQDDWQHTDHCEALLTGFETFRWNFTPEQKAYYQKLKADNDPNLRYFLDDILMKTATEQILKLPPLETQMEESRSGQRDSITTAHIPETTYENSISSGFDTLLKLDKESTAIQKLLQSNNPLKWATARIRWRMFLNNPKYQTFFESEVSGPSLHYLIMVLNHYDQWDTKYWGKGFWEPKFLEKKDELLESWKELHTSLPHMTRFSFQIMALKMEIEFMNRYRLQNIEKLRSRLEAELARP